MNLSIIDITTKKHGIRSKITINKKSIENHELFTNIMHKYRGLKKGETGFFRLLDSTRSFKYYTYTRVGEAEKLLNTVFKEYKIKLEENA